MIGTDIGTEPSKTRYVHLMVNAFIIFFQCPIAALPVVYRTTPEQPNFLTLIDPVTGMYSSIVSDLSSVSQSSSYYSDLHWHSASPRFDP